MEKRNYAWPITAIPKDDYELFTGWAEENKERIRSKDIMIFGAGIRGAEIADILSSIGITNIVFTDNNQEKWGGYIDDYPIIPVEEAYSQRDKYIFLVSVEEGAEICKDLEDKGFVLGETFFAPKNDLYGRFIKEYDRNMSGEILVLGDCMFEVIAFSDDNKESLSEILVNKLGKEKIKHQTMHGLSLPGFYHVLKGQINNGMIPRIVVIQLNFETLTGKQHLLPRSQHTELFKYIAENTEDQDGELHEYFYLTQSRLKNINAEFFTTNKYSQNSGRNNKNGVISDTASKIFFKLNYMYDLDINMESIQYLRKIMKMGHELSFAIIPFIPPINYERGHELFGEESFETAIQNNIQKLRGVLDEGNYELLDMSHMCKASEFADVTTPDETTNYEGRVHVADEICKRIRKESDDNDRIN